ncbi:MAG: hypothetical protein ACR2HE_08705 [Casimicrobiaceae bacterium]
MLPVESMDEAEAAQKAGIDLLSVPAAPPVARGTHRNASLSDEFAVDKLEAAHKAAQLLKLELHVLPMRDYRMTSCRCLTRRLPLEAKPC